jgi:hypothetical protein
MCTGTCPRTTTTTPTAPTRPDPPVGYPGGLENPSEHETNGASASFGRARWMDRDTNHPPPPLSPQPHGSPAPPPPHPLVQRAQPSPRNGRMNGHKRLFIQSRCLSPTTTPPPSILTPNRPVAPVPVPGRPTRVRNPTRGRIERARGLVRTSSPRLHHPPPHHHHHLLDPQPPHHHHHHHLCITQHAHAPRYAQTSGGTRVFHPVGKFFFDSFFDCLFIY